MRTHGSGGILQINKVSANDRTLVANSPLRRPREEKMGYVAPKPPSQPDLGRILMGIERNQIRHQYPTVRRGSRVDRIARSRWGCRRLQSTRALFVINQGMFCNQPGHRTARWPVSDPPLSSIKACDTNSRRKRACYPHSTGNSGRRRNATPASL